MRTAALLLALFGCADAASHRHHRSHARHLRSHSHRNHHAHQQHHHQQHHQHGIVKPRDKISVDEALGNLPAQVGAAFSQYRQTQDRTAAGTVLEQLNEVYERAMVDKDTMSLTCQDRKLEYTRQVRDARRGLMDVERQLTILMDRMQTTQTSMDRGLAEVEALRAQYEEHRRMCDRNREFLMKDLDVLQKDLPIATKLVNQVVAACGPQGGSMPALVQCRLADNSYVTTFGMADLREQVASLSGISERFVALNLERAIKGAAKPDAPSALLQTKVRNMTRKGTHKHFNQYGRGHKRAALLRKFLTKRSLNDEVCQDVVDPPTCESFGDNMQTLVGNIQDLMDELQQRGAAEDQHCKNSLDGYETQIKDLKRQSQDSGVALANAVAEQGEIAALRRAKRVQVKDVTDEVTREVGDCEQQLMDLDRQMTSAKKIVHELQEPVGSFVGDCEVGDWVRAPCTKTCGTGGRQNLTRQIISAPAAPGAKPRCPALRMERSCNEKPCPVDGAMTGWGEWSECSRQCGGGTRSRTRSVIQQAMFGGTPTAETMQEQLCNPQPCDRDCVLHDWTAWSNCSKPCMIGHRAKVRDVLRPAVGDASCPEATAPERLTMEPCNEHACAATAGPPKCNASIDLMLVVDSSGSVGSENFATMKTFVKDVAARVTLQSGEERDELGLVGLVAFGDQASVLQKPSNDAAALATAAEGMVWSKTGTNTAQALAVVRDSLENDGRPAVPSVVVVLTDGMPSSATLLATELKQLKDSKVRVVFVTIGAAITRHIAESWASFPPEENLLMVADFASLDEGKATELLADICPSLV